MESKISHIFLVDDDQALIEAIKEKLEGKGHTVNVAYDGKEGLTLALSKGAWPLDELVLKIEEKLPQK